MKETRYTVGEMANLCNVTAKQLRHYDEQGLLKPAHRDDRNGYRYYDQSQIEEVLLLTSLKALDLPNQRIAALMKQRDLATLSRELEGHLYAVRRERDQVVAKYDALIDNILRALGGLSLLGSRPVGEATALAVVDFPATWVAYTRYRCYWKASKLFISRRAELLKAMDQAGLEPVEVNMAIFHSDYKKQFSEDPSDNEGDLEVCYRVKHPDSQSPPLPADPRLPGGDLPVRGPLCGDAARLPGPGGLCPTAGPGPPRHLPGGVPGGGHHDGRPPELRDPDLFAHPGGVGHGVLKNSSRAERIPLRPAAVWVM